MLKMIDQVCEQVGLYPDIHLSGHSHLYERFTRTINGRQIPYLVAGMGGYPGLTGLKAGKPVQVPEAPQSGKDASGNPLTLETFNNKTFGFLRMTVSATELDVEFLGVDADTGNTAPMDGFTLNLKTGVVTDTAKVPANITFAQAASRASAAKKSSAQKRTSKKAPLVKSSAKAARKATGAKSAVAKTTAEKRHR
jgi:hypothetical protein